MQRIQRSFWQISVARQWYKQVLEQEKFLKRKHNQQILSNILQLVSDEFFNIANNSENIMQQ